MPEETPEYTLRPATAADSDFVYATRKAACSEYIERGGGEWDELRQQQLHIEHYWPENTRIIMLEQNPIGYVILKPREDHTLLGPIQVHPDFHVHDIFDVVFRELARDVAVRGFPLLLPMFTID